MKNKFFRDPELQHPEYGLRIDYSQSDCESSMSYSYAETRIQGLLEASDFDSIEIVLPFVGVLVDAFREKTKSVDVIKAFTRYVDMVNFMFRRRHETCWNEESLGLL